MKTAKELNAKSMLESTQKCVSNGKATVDLPRNLEEIRQGELWRQWRSASGQVFETFEAAITAPQPYGLGIGQYHGWLTGGQVWSLCKGFAELRKAVLPIAIDDRAPVATHGGNRAQEYNVILKKQQGNSADYLLGLMKREAQSGKTKAIRERVQTALDRLRKGELTSIHKAAVAAGVIKPKDSDALRNPLDRMKMYWKRATKKQRNDFILWTQKEGTT